MVLLPPAPQAGASASSATSAWPCMWRVSVLLCRRCRRRCCRWRWWRWRRFRRRCGTACAAHDRARPALAENREGQREQHEEYRCNRRRFRQQCRAGACAECRLAAAPPERARNIPAATLLQEDDERKNQTHEDIKSDQCVIHICVNRYGLRSPFTLAIDREPLIILRPDGS